MVIGGVIGPLIWVISIVTLLITLLITTREPPSSLHSLATELGEEQEREPYEVKVPCPHARNPILFPKQALQLPRIEKGEGRLRAVGGRRF